MATQLAIRFSDHDIEVLDELVRSGVASTRPEVIRIAIEHLLASERHRRSVAADLAGYIAHPETDDDIVQAEANAIAACAEEDWSELYPARGGR